MRLVVFTVSPAFAAFIEEHLDLPLVVRDRLGSPSAEPDCLHLLHLAGMEDECFEWLQQNLPSRCALAALCSDRPNLRQMLEGVRLGIKAYCNSYMAEIHYRQMLNLVANGQSWFPPHLLEQTFDLARQAARRQPSTGALESLTRREREIALAVGDGKSNRQIAEQFEISEPTVKTHLTNIFRKLDLKDRIGLVLMLKQT
jgi:DNA-binding NarL/FixJ family response regulator